MVTFPVAATAPAGSVIVLLPPTISATVAVTPVAVAEETTVIALPVVPGCFAVRVTTAA